MPQQEWFRIIDAYANLGFHDAEALRRWIRVGRKQGWLKIGKHIKPVNPNAKRVTWLVNFKQCDQIGQKVS